MSHCFRSCYSLVLCWKRSKRGSASKRKQQSVVRLSNHLKRTVIVASGAWSIGCIDCVVVGGHSGERRHYLLTMKEFRFSYPLTEWHGKSPVLYLCAQRAASNKKTSGHPL